MYIDYKVHFYLGLENKGEIESRYYLQPSKSLFSNCFKFSQTNGMLWVEEKLKINVTFIGNRIGEFNEVFKWLLKVTNKYIALNFKGNVITPSFEFGVDSINFSQVSFNFFYQKLIKVKNISRVPFVFKLRVPGDDTWLVQ